MFGMHETQQNSRALFTIQLASHTKSIGTVVRFDTSNKTKILKESIITIKEVGVGNMEGVPGHLPREHNGKHYYEGVRIDVNHNVPKTNQNKNMCSGFFFFFALKRTIGRTSDRKTCHLATC